MRQFVVSLAYVLLGFSSVSAFGQTGERRHPSQRSLTALSVDFSYDEAIANPLPDQAQIHLDLSGASLPESFAAQVILEDLSDAAAGREWAVEGRSEQADMVLTIEELEPNKVYRLWVNLYQSAEFEEGNAIGYVPFPYYFATASAEEMAQKRYRVVMKALKHYYGARKGWERNMDCWQFTRRYAGAEFDNWNRRTHHGADIPELAESGPIMGDYVRIPDYHSLLILAYDAEQDVVWSVEGNYNSTIEIGIRSRYRRWWVTHQSLSLLGS